MHGAPHRSPHAPAGTLQPHCPELLPQEGSQHLPRPCAPAHGEGAPEPQARKDAPGLPAPPTAPARAQQVGSAPRLPGAQLGHHHPRAPAGAPGAISD